MTIFLPDLPGYIFRFARRDDLPAIHQMLVCVSAADRTTFVDTLGDMLNQFIDPWSDPEKNYLLALTAEGQVAATGRVYINPVPQHERNAFLLGEVHPEHRGLGKYDLGDLILTWMEARARQRLQEFPADLPRSLRTACLDYLADRIRLFERHGFSPLRSFYRMRRDLSQPITDEYLPPGLILRTYCPELDRALRDAFNESFSDHWGFEPITYEDWQQFIIHAASFRPELSYLALDGEGSGAQITGFSVNFIREEDNQRQGIAEGIINELGTRHPWRKRGIASALVCESMRAFKAAGLDYAGLGVDTENPTGALGLYERLGFKVIKRSITFSRPVDPDGRPR
jgi:mycothiol synthase